MTPYNKIFKLHKKGLNYSQIEAQTGVTRKTIRNTIAIAENIGFVYKARTYSDLEIHRLLHPPKKLQEDYQTPLTDQMLCSLGLQNQSIRQLYLTYVDDCNKNQKTAYSKAQFYNIINDCSVPEYTGRICMVLLKDSYVSGDDSCHILLAYCMFSKHITYAIMQDLHPRSWIQAHNEIISDIGIPAELVYARKIPVRLYSATQEMIEYYGITLLENERPKINDLDNIRSSLSKSIRPSKVCLEYNSHPWLEHESFTRADAFRMEVTNYAKIDKKFDLEEILHPAVQINFHVEVDHNYYSVPFGLRHESITAICHDKTIILECDGQIIATHRRLFGRYQYSTVSEHMPSESQIPSNETSSQSLLQWAYKIGPATYSEIQTILDSREYPPQGYKSCLAILHLGQEFGRQQLERTIVELNSNSSSRYPLSSKTIRYSILKN